MALQNPIERLTLYSMQNFAIETLGCKVNQYESQQIRELLERLGLQQVGNANRPDLVIVNTCCVTHTASAKSRQHIRKAQRTNPDGVIVVCGCLPIAHTCELNGFGENTHVIRQREDLAAELCQIIASRSTILNHQSSPNYLHNTIKSENGCKVKCKNRLPFRPALEQIRSFQGHTRAFLKVQDGCDGCCSYCIIPRVRPNVHSKPLDAALQEARALVAAGHKEIVLTGVCLGAYGQDTVRRNGWPNQQNDKLAELLDEMANIPNLGRIRLSSLDPADLTPRLLETFTRHRNIMPHLHLSLQSGSNTVLRRMCRQYTVEDFLQKIEQIKRSLDRPAITTEIIVGFPGETNADFQQTVDLATQVGFAKMHIFCFSPRKGTAAAKMDNVVDSRVIKQRSKSLRDLDAKLQPDFRQQFIGETATVLLESDGEKPCGRCERYFMVYVDGPDASLKKNDLVNVKVVKNSKNGLIGKVVRGKLPASPEELLHKSLPF
jgi:threonylcarbamoyladenosine tRNA methylthiotransferase MtaB